MLLYQVSGVHVRAFCSQKSLFAHRELAEVLGIAIHVSRLACSNGHVFIHLEADRTEWCACHISMTVFARCWGTVRESHIDRLPLPRRSWNKVEGFTTGKVIRQWKLLIQGGAKLMELSWVTHVPSGPIGCAGAGHFAWQKWGGNFKQGETFFAPRCMNLIPAFMLTIAM